MSRKAISSIPQIDELLRDNREISNAAARKKLGDSSPLIQRLNRLWKIASSEEGALERGDAVSSNSATNTASNRVSDPIPKGLAKYLNSRNAKVSKMIWPHEDALSSGVACIRTFLLDCGLARLKSLLSNPEFESAEAFSDPTQNCLHASGYGAFWKLVIPEAWRSFFLSRDTIIQVKSILTDVLNARHVDELINVAFTLIQSNFIANFLKQTSPFDEWNICPSSLESAEATLSQMFSLKLRDFPYQIELFEPGVDESAHMRPKDQEDQLITMTECILQYRQSFNSVQRKECIRTLLSLSLFIKLRQILKDSPLLSQEFINLWKSICRVVCESFGKHKTPSQLRDTVFDETTIWRESIQQRHRPLWPIIERLIHVSSHLVFYNLKYVQDILVSLGSSPQISEEVITISELYVQAWKRWISQTDSQKNSSHIKETENRRVDSALHSALPSFGPSLSSQIQFISTILCLPPNNSDPVLSDARLEAYAGDVPLQGTSSQKNIESTTQDLPGL